MKYNHILTLLLGCFIINANAIDFHVSPNGNDAAEGTLTAPFKTLERAQRAVRGVNKSMSEDINVYLHEGTYQLTSTLRLSNADGGTNGHYVRYMAAPGETPLVTGGVPVNGWELYDADKNIWCAKDVVNRFRQLYVNGKKAIRARHPNVKPNGDHYFNRLAKVDTFGRAFDVYTDQIKKLENMFGLNSCFMNLSNVICTFFNIIYII